MSFIASIIFNMDVSDLANQLIVPMFNGVDLATALVAQIPYHAIKIETGEKVYQVRHSSISAASAASVELINDTVDYQTTGTARAILIIISSGTVTDFEVFEGDSANATTTSLEDFGNVSMANGRYMTTKVLTLAASKYLTVKANTGNILSVFGYIIE